MQTRLEGYYWVRFHPDDDLEIGYWNGQHWTVIGSEARMSDKIFYEIGREPLKP